MAKYKNRKPLSLIQQAYKIRQDYKNVDIQFCKDHINVTLAIKPTENSNEYTVRIYYKIGISPRIYLVKPDLVKREGHYPHHIYGFENDKPRLCVYFPEQDKWDDYSFIADTIIPWISTWLFAYEFWQITGIWHYDESNFNKNSL